MKFQHLHIFHSPKRDAIMLVHTPPRTTDGPVTAVDHTHEAVQSMMGWVFKESWEGQSTLPPVMRWWLRLCTWVRRAPLMHTATGTREIRLLKGRTIRITVDVYQDTEWFAERLDKKLAEAFEADPSITPEGLAPGVN